MDTMTLTTGGTGTAPMPVGAADSRPQTMPPPARAGRPGRIRRLWRGAEADPGWARPALLGLLLVTLVLYTWNLTASGWANSFYSAAVQAGSESWKAFFFGSSDAANSITVDKPPASLWVMALSVRLLGLNSFAILLPQALMGVATVGVVHTTVKRQFGAAAGLIAGAVLALTPVAALMFTFNNPDALLTLLMALGAWATIKAIEKASPKWMMIVGVFIGLGRLSGDETGSVGGGGGATGGSMWGSTGLFRMFSSSVGDQISWLIPSALILLAAGLWLRGRRPRTDLRRAAYLVWGGWLVVTMLVFSFMAGIFHEYYTVALAPAIGALVGMGAVEAWQRRSGAVATIALAAATAAAATWSFILLSRTTAYGDWLRISVLAVGMAESLLILATRWMHARSVPFVLAAALVAGLAGPGVYAVSTTAQGHSGSIVTAGPAGASRGPGGGGGFGGGTPPQLPGQTGQTGQAGQPGQTGPNGTIPQGGP